MSALAADALSGLAVRRFGPGLAALARGLAGLGAELVEDDGGADLALVAVDAGGPPLDAAADGALATALTTGFRLARDAEPALRPGGCLLFLLCRGDGAEAADDPARAGIAALTRTLALEWAPERRVNALVCRGPEDAVELAALVAWRPSRTLTGAVIDGPAG